MKTTTKSQESDNELIRNLQETNSHKAMVAIWASYWNPLLYHCLSLTHDEALANDIAQTTMIKVWENASTFNLANENILFAWMRRVANNNFYNHIRTTIRIVNMVETIAKESSLSNVAHPCYQADSLCIEREMKILIAAAINSLTPICREPLELRYIEGLSNPQIAKRLGITMKVLKGRMHRAVVALRLKLLAA